jgi:hypothetical protein
MGEVVIPYSAVRQIIVLGKTSEVFTPHTSDYEAKRTIH